MNELNHAVKPRFKKWLILFISTFAALLFLASLSKAQTVYSFTQRKSWGAQCIIRMTSSANLQYRFTDQTEVSSEKRFSTRAGSMTAGLTYAEGCSKLPD